MLVIKIAAGVIIGLLFVRLFPSPSVTLAKKTIDALIRIEKQLNLIWIEDKYYAELKQKVCEFEKLTDEENKTHDELFKRKRSKDFEREIEKENLLKRIAQLLEQSHESQLIKLANIKPKKTAETENTPDNKIFRIND